jgi:hypothetical protein
MPTNFPTSVDNFTNPTANDSLNLPSHSTQHANANDAIEAVESYLLAGGAGYSGLVKIIPTGATNGTVSANGDVTIGSAVGSVTVSGVFSSAYDNYKIIMGNVDASVIDNNVWLKFNNATIFKYLQQYDRYDGGAGGTARSNGTTDGMSITLADTNNATAATIEVMSPFIAKPTNLVSSGSNLNFTSRTIGYCNNDVSHTGFQILAFSGNTLTGGTIRVYGYK